VASSPFEPTTAATKDTPMNTTPTNLDPIVREITSRLPYLHGPLLEVLLKLAARSRDPLFDDHQRYALAAALVPELERLGAVMDRAGIDPVGTIESCQDPGLQKEIERAMAAGETPAQTM
jgi:hypothetical protein